MRLAITGATGRTGITLIEQALGRGHHVRALVRTPEKAGLLPTHEHVEIVPGNLLDADEVTTLLEGADAVLNVAGQVKGAPEDLQQRGIRHVLDAMAAHGIDRLVTLTGAGVRDPQDEPKIPDRVIRGLLSLLQGAVLRDSEAYVEQVRRSPVRWTVVRGPRLTDDAARGSFRAFPTVGADSGTKIARADLAAFLLDEVEQDAYVGKMPVVSW